MPQETYFYLAHTQIPWTKFVCLVLDVLFLQYSASRISPDLGDLNLHWFHIYVLLLVKTKSDEVASVKQKWAGFINGKNE
jgi:hypothetical protein